VSASLLEAELVSKIRGLRPLFGAELALFGNSANFGNLAGTGTEFLEQRRYAPGDDVRRVDWFATARRGEPHVKVHRNEDDAWVRVFLDSSRSMACGEPTKFSCAQKLCAALGYWALLHGHRVQSVSANPHASEGCLVAPARHGTYAAPAWTKDLAALSPNGKISVGNALEQLQRSQFRPSRIVFVSDFTGDAALLSGLARLAQRGHDLLLLQIYAADEFNTSTRGEVLFEDSETGQLLRLHVDEDDVATYQRGIQQQVSSLHRWSRAQRCRYLLVPSEESPLKTLTRLLSKLDLAEPELPFHG
jgi:uncharacterized protein (DUF58 family)